MVLCQFVCQVNIWCIKHWENTCIICPQWAWRFWPFSLHVLNIPLLVFANRAVRWIRWWWRGRSCTAWAVTLTLRHSRAAPTPGSPTALPAPSAIPWECRAEPRQPWEECSIHSNRFVEDFSGLLWFPSSLSLPFWHCGNTEGAREKNPEIRISWAEAGWKTVLKLNKLCLRCECFLKSLTVRKGFRFCWYLSGEREVCQMPWIFFFFPVDTT